MTQRHELEQKSCLQKRPVRSYVLYLC